MKVQQEMPTTGGRNMNIKTKRAIAVPGLAAGVLGICALFAPTPWAAR